MRHHIGNLMAGIWVVVSLVSCHSNQSDKSSRSDSAVKTATDTAIIPGTPGPSGTEPGPGDTTQSHRDSLKRVKDISDSSGKPASPAK
jgi:hypothetical protein